MRTLLALFVILNSNIFAQSFIRTSLIEEFTGESCQPCATYNPPLDSILASHPTQIIPLKWMVPIPTIPFQSWSLYQTNKAEIDWRYSGAGSGGYGYPTQNTPTNTVIDGILNAPTVRVDGRHQWNFGSLSDHPFYTHDSVINDAQSKPTNFAIMMNTAWDPNFNNCAVTVTVQSNAVFTATGSLVFRLCLIERTINFSSPPGTNGETLFHNAVRQSYPTTINGNSVTAMGTILPGTWAANQTQTFVVNCAVPSYVMDKTQMAFVGFVQDDGTRFIYQAARTAQPVITSIETFKKEEDLAFEIYPNPVTSDAVILINALANADIKINITNATGQQVYGKQCKINSGANALNIDPKNLAPGIYTVVIESGKKTLVKKLVVGK